MFELGVAVSAAAMNARAALPRKPDAQLLRGPFVDLAPWCEAEHAGALWRSTGGGAAHGHPAYDAEMLVWRHLWGAPADEGALRERLGAMHDDPSARLWTICAGEGCPLLAAGECIGTISAQASRPGDLVVEVGMVVLTPALQRTPACADAVFTLLAHLFALGYRRVEWKCNALNVRSRAAAGRFGFTFEGTFRHHMIVQGGRSRDTAWHAMLADEWAGEGEGGVAAAATRAWLASPEALALFARRAGELTALRDAALLAQ